MLVLLSEGDGGVLIAHPHAQGGAAGADGKLAIAQLAGEVKRLASGLLTRQAQRVVSHRRLDALAHHARGTEEPVRRRRPFKPLVRTLEVVVLDEQVHPTLAVLEVREHRPREQLLPQRLPEPLDLAAGLWMMRTALDVLDPVPLQFRFELRRAAPRGVLTALVGQDLPRRPVLGDRPRQRL
jgi:hypothetical protein